MNRPLRIAGVLLAAASLAACTVGPDYTPPKPPAGAAGPLAEADPRLTFPAEGPDAWWRLYADPRLDRLIAEAFAANTDLKSAEANLAASRAILEVSRSAQYPATEAEAGGVYGRDPRTNQILEVAGAKPFSDWTFDALLDMSYEVDLFGKVRRSIEAARAESGAAEAARDGLRVTIAAETTRAYAEICTLGEALQVQRRSVDLATREDAIAHRRLAAGAASDFDVVRADALVEQTSAALPPLEGARKAALYELAALLGRVPGDAPVDVLHCVAPPRLASLIPVGNGAALLRRRPDVRAAERRLAAATAKIGVATADLYPQISLTGFWGGVYDKIDLLDTEKALSWGVGPSISWDFPNQMAPRARIRAAKAETAGALAAFDGTVLNALKEVSQALATYSAELDHRRRLGVLEAEEQKAYDIAHGQYGAGAISQLDLLSTEQALIAAEAAVAQSDGALAQDQIAVFKALGGGWKTAPGTKP